MRALPLLSPLLSGHQALDTPSLASFQKHDEGIQSEIEVEEAQLCSVTKNVPDYTDCATTLNIC